MHYSFSYTYGLPLWNMLIYDTPSLVMTAFERSGGKIGKGMLCVEYSDHGTGDFRSPSFTVIDNR